jgi:hypothetical protein
VKPHQILGLFSFLGMAATMLALAWALGALWGGIAAAAVFFTWIHALCEAESSLETARQQEQREQGELLTHLARQETGVE